MEQKKIEPFCHPSPHLFQSLGFAWHGAGFGVWRGDGAWVLHPPMLGTRASCPVLGWCQDLSVEMAPMVMSFLGF